MRDIKDYEEKYMMEPCEKYQVLFRRKKVLEILGRYKHHNVLEVGCGLEPLFQFCTNYHTMTIVEPGEKFIDNAKRIAKESDKKIECIQDFFENSVVKLQKLNHVFDFIVVSSLLHEVENPQKLLQSIYAVCDENTVLHINVPNSNSIHRLLAKEMGLIADTHEVSILQKTMQRNRVYDLHTLVEEVEKAGFIILEQGTYFPKFLSATQMEKMLEDNIISENIFGGLDKMIKYFPEYGSEIYIQAKKQQ